MPDLNLEHVKHFRFTQLFVDDLGWDRPAQQQPYSITIGDEVFALDQVAHKRGVQVLQCRPDAQGRVPAYATRQKIERKVTAEAREHLIVFTDADHKTQVWQWVARLTGKPVQYREVFFRRGESAELLKQKLSRLRFTLDEEAMLTVLGVTARLDDALPRDKVTKKFYTEFKKQRDAFEQFIEGVPKLGDDLHWYAAVLIDRLMFIWFLQEKQFLDGNKRYLQDRLVAHGASAPAGSFYRQFLCPLFFRGFAEERTDNNRAAIAADFGQVPYLNGGLFSQHELEQRYGAALDVADGALEKLFTFFDTWEWHLDDRPLKNDREINPDVLGYIFEKFVNQKQMGAYYTKEDITEYIGKNTIIPALLHKVRSKYPAAFDALAWPLLNAEPDRYIYPAMLKGVEQVYPTDIETGRDKLAPDLLTRRQRWNNKTPDVWALPTEIWRETIARHDRTRELRVKLAAGDIREIGDLITWNLDIRRFAQDVIERCTDAALLREFWAVLAGRVPRKSGEKFRPALSVLDPTCGSGAFLFAALNILKPLYDAALGTMAGLLLDADQADDHKSAEKWKDIEETTERFGALRGDRASDYAVIKHIIVHNLYGVDIEEQATEIAKLRLFLKLVSLLEPGDTIEPLPDIDFNIRHGNTLVGYASADETEAAVKGSVQTNLLFSDPWEDIRIRLESVKEAYQNFQIQQVQRGGHVTSEDKQALSIQLAELENMLNFHLYRSYGKDPAKTDKFMAWKAAQKPFHWYVDFFPLMEAGGFDAVIGNPPYVVYPSEDVPYSWPDNYYKCHDAKNLYALVAERSISISRLGIVGLIVQLTSMCSERLASLQAVWLKGSKTAIMSFPRRPESVFEGVEMPTAIWLRLPAGNSAKNIGLATSAVRRFYTAERGFAIDSTRLWSHEEFRSGFRIAKFGDRINETILAKLLTGATVEALSSRDGKYRVYYQEACRYWAKSSCFSPRFVRNGEAVEQPHGRTIILRDDQAAGFVNCLINSSLFYWYYSTLADCEHINDGFVRRFPLPANWSATDWSALSALVDVALKRSAVAKTINTKQGHVIEYDEINGKAAAAVIALADTALAKAFGLTEHEADHVLSYDTKYRMMLGAATSEADD